MDEPRLKPKSADPQPLLALDWGSSEEYIGSPNTRALTCGFPPPVFSYWQDALKNVLSTQRRPFPGILVISWHPWLSALRVSVLSWVPNSRLPGKVSPFGQIHKRSSCPKFFHGDGGVDGHQSSQFALDREDPLIKGVSVLKLGESQANWDELVMAEVGDAHESRWAGGGPYIQ